MLERMRAWLASRRAERKEREQRQVEDFTRGEDEARRGEADPHDIAEDRVQHPAQNAPPV